MADARVAAGGEGASATGTGSWVLDALLQPGSSVSAGSLNFLDKVFEDSCVCLRVSSKIHGCECRELAREYAAACGSVCVCVRARARASLSLSLSLSLCALADFLR